MDTPTRPREHGLALALYGLVTLAFNWPLPLLMGSRLPGAVTGDTGVYVWNLWVFRHEILAHGRFPLFTGEILGLSQQVALGYHNYTLFADLLAFPLIPTFGVTGTFNLLYLALSTATAWSGFALARSAGARQAEAWLAGLLFGFSPILIARSAAHFSLASAAPLALFAIVLQRTRDGYRPSTAALLGAIAGWASWWDAYYGIFCIVIAATYVTTRHVGIERRSGHARTVRALRIVDGAILIAAALIAWIMFTGGSELRIGRWAIAMKALYTPVLVVTSLVVIRLAIARRAVTVIETPPAATMIRFTLVAAGACLVAISPMLVALASGVADGAQVHGPIPWRSSPPGVDLLALFAPNPNHGWFGAPWRAWLERAPNGIEENVASLTLVGVAVVALAVFRYRYHPPRVWSVLTVALAALAIGPFVRVGGVNTYVPGPWALLRYLPILTATRMPARYAIPMMMAFSVVFALALDAISRTHPRRRAILLGVVGAALLFELSPYPRRLFPSRVPQSYQMLATDPRDVRVLQLPFGYKDGERTFGQFSTAWQFYQTFHEKRLVGGYLSRLSPGVVQRQAASPNVQCLIRLSEGRDVSAADLDNAKRRAPGFVDRLRVGYVVMDLRRTSPALRRFAVEAYGLAPLSADADYGLFIPTVGQLAEDARRSASATTSRGVRLERFD